LKIFGNFATGRRSFRQFTQRRNVNFRHLTTGPREHVITHCTEKIRTTYAGLDEALKVKALFSSGSRVQVSFA